MGQDRADDQRCDCLSRHTTMVEGAETLAHGRVWLRRRCDYRQRRRAQGLLNLQSTRDRRARDTLMNDLDNRLHPSIYEERPEIAAHQGPRFISFDGGEERFEPFYIAEWYGRPPPEQVPTLQVPTKI